jgi:hypothetical protein
MSVKVSALCWQIPLPIADKLVLLRLADYADNDGGKIFPSVATVAHFCGVSERAVQYILKKLTDDGLLFVVGNATGGRGKTRHYAIDLERACQLAGPAGGQSNGTGKRAQRVQDDCTLSEPAETPQRVQNDAVKGEVDLHPTLQEPSEEESKGSLCVELESTPREAHTQGTPSSSEKKSAARSNVVPFVPPSIPEVMPDGWVLPDEYRDWALAKGWTDVDGAAEKFANHWLGKRDRGDRDAANTEAGWLRQWKGWINGNLKWERDHGKQRHNHRNGGHGDLASVVLADLPGWLGYAEGGSNPR